MKDDGLSSGIKKAASNVEDLGDKLKNTGDFVKKFSTVANEITGAIIKAGAAAGTALYGLGAVAAKIGMDYEAAMSQVAATMGITADKADEDFKKLGDAAKEAGATTMFSATQASEALNFLALAGFDAEKSVESLPKVLNLAAAGGLDLAYASDLVTDAMSALGIETDGLTGFTDELAKTAQKSNTSVAQLGEGILTVGGLARDLSGGTVELNTALGILADNGIKGSEGGTKLRNVMLSLMAPVDKAAGLMAEMGVNAFDATGELRPLQDVFSDLNTALADATADEKANVLTTIFNKQDLVGVNALLSTTSERWEALSDEITNSEGAASQMAATMQNNLKGAITTLKSGLEGLAIQFYESIDSPLKDVAEKSIGYVAQLSSAFSEEGLSGMISQLGTIVADIAVQITEQAPKMIEVAVSLINALVDGLTENTDIILTGTVTTFSTIIDGVKEILPKLVPLAIEAIEAFTSGFIEYQELIFVTGVDILTQLIQGVSRKLPDLIPQAKNAIMNIVRGLSENLPLVLESAIEIVSELAFGIASMLPELIPVAIDAIITLVETLISNVDLLIDAAIALVLGLTDGIMDALPILIDRIPDILIKIVAAIIKSLPKIVEAGINLMHSLREGILKALPGLLTLNFEIVEKIARALGFERIADIIAAGKELVRGFWEGISGAAIWLYDKVDGFILGLINGVKNMLGIRSPSTVFADIGTNLVNGLWQGISDMISNFSTNTWNFFMSVVDIAKNVFSFSTFTAIGTDIVNGVWNGISSMASNFARNVTSFFSGIVDGVKNTLGIHSPSTVFAAIGEDTSEGFIEGVLGTQKKIDNVMDKVFGSFDSASIDFGLDAKVNPLGAINAQSFSLGNNKSSTPIFTYSPVNHYYVDSELDIDTISRRQARDIEIEMRQRGLI